MMAWTDSVRNCCKIFYFYMVIFYICGIHIRAANDTFINEISTSYINLLSIGKNLGSIFHNANGSSFFSNIDDDDEIIIFPVPFVGDVIVDILDMNLISLGIEYFWNNVYVSNWDGTIIHSYSDLKFSGPINFHIGAIHSDSILKLSFNSSYYTTSVRMNTCLTNASLTFHFFPAWNLSHWISNFNFSLSEMSLEMFTATSMENVIFNVMKNYYFDQVKHSISSYINRRLLKIWNHISILLSTSLSKTNLFHEILSSNLLNSLFH